MSESNAIDHLEAIREDLRDEIKRRIEQRDKYSIQLTIALAAILAIGFGSKHFGKALLAAPLVSVYFTVLILYSYRIHRLLASYLREEIEPELASLCGTDPEKEWETYYQAQEVPGIRKRFFVVALWAVCILCPGYLLVAEGDDPAFAVALALGTAIYVLAATVVTAYFWGE